MIIKHLKKILEKLPEDYAIRADFDLVVSKAIYAEISHEYKQVHIKVLDIAAPKLIIVHRGHLGMEFPGKESNGYWTLDLKPIEKVEIFENESHLE